jgi:predicted transcriptional regulator
MKTIEITVVDPKQDLAQLRALARRIDDGERVPEATPQLKFVSLKQLFSAITEKRLELIRYVAAHAGLNTHQLAQALGRDYKNVYQEVRELCEYGLLVKGKKGDLQAPYDQIVIRADVRSGAQAA